MSCDFRIIDKNYVFESNTELLPSSEDSNFPVSNLKKFFRSKVWRTTDTVDQALVIDLKSAEEIDSFAMIFDPIMENRFSDSAVFKLQASATDTWASPAVDVTLQFDDNNETITYFFDTPEEYRYWRVVLDDEFNPDGFLEVHKLVLGKKLDLSRAPQSGFSLNFEDISQKDQTLYGHEYVDVYPIKKSISFDLSYLEYDDAETLMESFYRNGSVNPVLVCLDAGSDLFDKDRVTIYGKFEKQLGFQHVIRDVLNTQLTLLEAF